MMHAACRSGLLALLLLACAAAGAQSVSPAARPSAPDHPPPLPPPLPAPRPVATAAQDPAAASTRTLRGDHAFQQGQYTQAYAHYLAAEGLLGDAATPALQVDLRYRQGRALVAANRHDAAIAPLQSALALQRPVGDALLLGQILHVLAEAVGAGNAPLPARALFDEALAQRRAAHDVAGEVRTLVNYAQWHVRLGEWGAAVARLDQASAVATVAGAALRSEDHNRLASSIGVVRALLGQYPLAQAAFAQAGALSRASGDALGVAESQRNQAFVALESGDAEAARALYLQSIEALPETAWLPRALGLNGAGYALVRMRRGAEAAPLLEDAVATLRRAGDELELARALESLASARVLLGEVDIARRHYAQSLSLARRHGALDDEREVLLSLARLSLAQAQPGAAELYLKLAVDVSQRLRLGAAALAAQDRKALAQRLVEPYKLLARLLVEQQRLLEAERVLLALKDAEFADFTRGDEVPTTEPVLSAEERASLSEINDTGETLGRIYSELAALARGQANLAPQEQARLRSREEQALNRLVGALSGLDQKLAARRAVPLVPALMELRLGDTVSQLALHAQGEAAAMLMFVPDQHLTTVLLAGPFGSRALALPVGLVTLVPLISALRQALIDKADYVPAARALHRVLVAPVEKELARDPLPPSMWMLFLTDELRYLPFAALIDADGRHLVEKVRLSQLITSALDQLLAPARDWTISAFGSTLAAPAHRLSALPAARIEVLSLVRTTSNPQGLMAGHSWLDEQFTREAWQATFQRLGLPAPQATVIHVASHFKIVPGDWNNSFLLLGGNDEFRVSELRSAANLSLRHVDLVTLSACATELNDQASGRELEGFGALLLKRGARAVIGTLWAVQDEGTAALMQRFYGARGERRQMSKAAAMQQAQLDLLQGRVRATNAALDLRHPHYWAPFVLMGNWL